jgi:hypothetical protein
MVGHGLARTRDYVVRKLFIVPWSGCAVRMGAGVYGIAWSR